MLAGSIRRRQIPGRTVRSAPVRLFSRRAVRRSIEHGTKDLVPPSFAGRKMRDVNKQAVGVNNDGGCLFDSRSLKELCTVQRHREQVPVPRGPSFEHTDLRLDAPIGVPPRNEPDGDGAADPLGVERIAECQEIIKAELARKIIKVGKEKNGRASGALR